MKRKEILRKYEAKPDNLLYILHDIQDASPYNYVTEEDMEEIADFLGLPYSKVYGTATFYSMISQKPRGKHVIRLCDSPPCHLMGSESILDILKEELGIDVGQTTPDMLFTLEITSCLGVCGVAPAMMIDEEVFGNLTPKKLRKIIKDYREGNV
ncbi:MAG TPA: NADH-quinone oxidoreductase subunit NuoE [Candidatus Mcinerneyibacteriales bacterium]|jgi:NADH-quinone oxidoreductase E subunit|nr:NADH-quinone oxidoreductase subunit NuoE [Candidatus Mcinerneyibacteriota bacterium]HPE20621.1 NADH-quinone oxidoreductase subunit NuoE [Candidatus Mcinerneyibacteriales bacterium]HPJ69665.1 NADH-quinone oxidoreductase subunit NuoE [Candidatus Mcinerneyibacteriales bacterium]HPQ88899.1 NADH-quinone oxidoreductase subunit NuoE [Candidatus Mcinerneyibacteriales bacterium]